MIFNLFKRNRTQKEFRYLQNPYFQFSCWLNYRTSDPVLAEEMLKLVIDLKGFCLKLDAMNKQRFKENFDKWHAYNIWMDVIVSEYLNEYIDRLKEGIYIRRKSSNEYVYFDIDINVIRRILAEKGRSYEDNYPNEKLQEEFHDLVNKIDKYDRFFKISDPSLGRGSIAKFLSYITDNKERDSVNLFESGFLEEPEIYPTYLVYPKAYKTSDEVEYQGVYISDNPCKDISLYTSDFENFRKSFFKNKDMLNIIGSMEYGFYDPDSPYNIDPNKSDEDEEISGETAWVESEFYYVKEIPPNTEGIPNNPLRLEHLRYPLKENEHFPTIAELQAKSGFVYQHPHYKVETYSQVVNRYERFYSNYLREHGVDEALLKDYTER